MKNSQRFSSRWMLMFAIPVGVVLIIGCVYLGSENRALLAVRAAEKAQNDVMHGEIYRLRQQIDQQNAKMNYILSPGFERYRAYDSDSNYCWLFFRPADNAWYVEVSSAAPLKDAEQFRLYMLSPRAEPISIGHFERIADAVGLQKIGEGEKGTSALITAADRESDPILTNERALYEVRF